ncbi:unnamed protein product, partial [Musa banksii]
LILPSELLPGTVPGQADKARLSCFCHSVELVLELFTCTIWMRYIKLYGGRDTRRSSTDENIPKPQ